jgi:hypothetical protein
VTRQLLGYAALILAALVVSPVASAEPGAYSPDDDERFYRLLTEDFENSPGITVTDRLLVRTQALQACQRSSEGMRGALVVINLMREGAYSFDVASRIVSAGRVIYCPENLSP